MPKALPEEVREQLLEAAENIVWRVGFAKMTIDDIAADVQISKGTVYRFFASKEEIGDAIVEHYTDAMCRRQSELAEASDLSWRDRIQGKMMVPSGWRTTSTKTLIRTNGRYDLWPRERAFASVNNREVQLLARLLKAGAFRSGNTMQMARSLRLLPPGVFRLTSGWTTRMPLLKKPNPL